MRIRAAVWLAMGLLLVSAVGAQADVKSRQKTQVKFEGMLGRMAGMFGGKAAKEGIVSTVAVKGDRQLTVTDQTGELVDLKEEKIYRIDFKGKSYKVQTFAEIRKEWEDARAKMKEESGQSKEKGDPAELEIDVDIKKTGQRKTVSGYACDEVVTTITMRQKGKKIEDGGGMVITADSWMGPRIAAMQEQLAFQQRYMKKLFGSDSETMARDMAQAMAMYPQLKTGMARMQNEAGKLEGTAVLTIVTMESVATPEQAKANADQDKGGGVLGGIGGMFGKKKKADQPAAGGAAPAAVKNRATIMTSTTELLGVETSVAPADIDLPAGFKQK